MCVSTQKTKKCDKHFYEVQVCDLPGGWGGEPQVLERNKKSVRKHPKYGRTGGIGNMKLKRNFFTLIEILTVMAILAVLAGIVVGGVVVVNSKNAETQTLATIKTLEMALTRFKNETGSVYTCDGWNFPSIALTRVVISQNVPANVNGTLWKYLDQKVINSSTKVDGANRYFVDAWGNPILYRVPGKFNSSSFDLGSVGPDGNLGNDGTSVAGATALPVISIENYNKFGTGDDITNFVRK